MNVAKFKDFSFIITGKKGEDNFNVQSQGVSLDIGFALLLSFMQYAEEHVGKSRNEIVRMPISQFGSFWNHYELFSEDISVEISAKENGNGFSFECSGNENEIGGSLAISVSKFFEDQLDVDFMSIFFMPSGLHAKGLMEVRNEVDELGNVPEGVKDFSSFLEAISNVGFDVEPEGLDGVPSEDPCMTCDEYDTCESPTKTTRA